MSCGGEAIWHRESFPGVSLHPPSASASPSPLRPSSNYLTPLITALTPLRFFFVVAQLSSVFFSSLLSFTVSILLSGCVSARGRPLINCPLRRIVTTPCSIAAGDALRLFIYQH